MTLRSSAAMACLIPALLGAQTGRAPSNDVIAAPKMRADLEFLSGDWFRGRLTDTPENAMALEWVKSRFEWLGLMPKGGNGTYFLPHKLSLGDLGSNNDLAITRNGQTTHYAVGSAFYPHRYSAAGSVTADVAFAHFGIRAPSLGYDDLQGDVRGKILVVLDHEPGESDSTSKFDGVVTSEFSNPLRKALAAQDAGAVGVLFVSDVHNHQNAQNFAAAERAYWPDLPPHLLPYTLAAWANRLSIPVGQISAALGDSLVGGLADASRASETTSGQPVRPLPGLRMAMATSVTRRDIPDRNVV